jgi:hypothetical protein
LGLIAIAAGIVWDIFERMQNPERMLIPQASALGIELKPACHWLNQIKNARRQQLMRPTDRLYQSQFL